MTTQETAIQPNDLGIKYEKPRIWQVTLSK